MAKKKVEDGVVEISAVNMEAMDVFILGTSPLLCNRLSEKARRELFMPAGKKNSAERQMTLKHHPLAEYRSSPYLDVRGDAAARIVHPGAAFRRAIASAALDVPGATKAQAGRLVKVKEYNVSIFGVPQISAMIVRQASIQRTPDVRVRAVLPEWACKLTVLFSHPLFKPVAVLNLLAAAGDWIGIGDGRNEKGALSFGCFRLCEADDPDWVRVVRGGGAAAQDEALDRPVAFDAETEELLAWFDKEVVTRGARSNGQAPKEKARKEKVTADDEV